MKLAFLKPINVSNYEEYLIWKCFFLQKFDCYYFIYIIKIHSN